MQGSLTLFPPAPLIGAPSRWDWLRWMALAAALVMLVAVADYVTGYELSLSILYLLPILLATWTLGFSAGLMCSLVSLLAWLLSDAAMGHEYSRSLYHWWEG